MLSHLSQMYPDNQDMTIHTTKMNVMNVVWLILFVKKVAYVTYIYIYHISYSKS